MKPNRKYKVKKSNNSEEIENIKSLCENVKDIDPESISNFSSLPMSNETQKGLKENKYEEPTKVQRLSLVHSLRGLDVVGAAKTGSGKTLAFIIPALELLHRKLWNNLDGLGVLIITPTRELAYQIYEVINKVGKYHSFSAGLVIGGKDLKFEWNRITNCNILICTPGRLLHHMTENPEFSVENLQMLILDEADLCLSLGFEDLMNTILGELPSERQTLLFSATQTRNLQNLIRAGCKNPVFCSVHEFSKTVTPKTLQESYVVYDESQKISFLYSFLKHYKKAKILVFLSTCKQVKFINELFTHLRPGLTVMCLHGNMNQLRRMAVFDEFCKKKRAVLFATDVASRGLDIPSVSWVLQLDCPDDVKTYIHRVGRTARHTNTGEGLLVLTPTQEEPMIKKLRDNNISIEKLIVNAKELTDITGTVESILGKFNRLIPEAERVFKTYIKCYCLSFMRNKEVFDVTSLDLDSYARSLGLRVTPNCQFLKRFLKQNSLKLANDNKSIDFDSTCNNTKHKLKTRLTGITEDDEEEDGFMHVTKSDPIKTNINPEDILKDYSLYINPSKEVNKFYVAKKIQKKNVELNKRIVFDDDGDVTEKDQGVLGESQKLSLTSFSERQELLQAQDAIDKKQNSLRVKEMHRLEKEKLKALKQKKNKFEDEDGLEEEEEESEDDYDSFTNQIIDELPDPDKIYNKKDENSSTESSESEAESEVSESESEDFESESENSEDESKQFGSFTKKPEINKLKKKEKTNKILAEDKDFSKQENGTQNKEKKSKSNHNFRGKRKAKEEAKAVKRAKMEAENDLSSITCSEKESLALYLLQKT